MNSTQTQRMEALRLYSKLARTNRFKRRQAKIWGSAPSVAVVPVLESDRVVEAEERVRRAGGAADVVVYWPDEGRIVVAHVAHKHVDRDPLFGVDPVGVHDESTVGMLMSLIDTSGPVFTTTTRAEMLALS